MSWRTALLAVLFALIAPLAAGAAEGSGSVNANDWEQYKARFLDPGGRIIDDGNGNVSHSEGQGYGLLLAVLAENPADFALIWSFTRRELLLRDDGLAAWKWSPSETPHVIDINNATDGDILIAYALVLAAERWQRDDYLQAAARIAKAILDHAVLDHGGHVLLMPGVSGFGTTDRPDGPVVNPSYWIFEAFPVLDRVAPSQRWKEMSDAGLWLLAAAQTGARKLPTDWVSLRAAPKPAQGFPAEFGYNALRIPLYLARADMGDRELMMRLRSGIAGNGDSLVLTDASGAVQKSLSDPGYRFVNHILACVLDRVPIPDSVKVFSPTQYYPSTLHLLGLSYVKEKRPECL
ncbi:MAG TPA: glycosyl hydrolase family 8 [Ensifer sp.]|jgi:endoglucanase|uniref:glycosyl hydrolase family 8 n=1 Tax=Ensifer sp. TaxID=1872086 RepID=UPI002E1674C0|nr:glycosyl hydrolase family 8 [Ensifer sp.]